MADEYNRLAMYSAPVAPVENRLAQAVLPQGHPSNMLMWLRDQIPQIQADDTSTMSGITSRLGRTVTAIPRAGLETMSNWLRGTHDPNAVRIGEDTIAPFGMFPMGMAGRAASGAARASDAAISARLGEQFPGEIGGGDLVRMRIAGANRLGVSGEDGMTSLYRTDGAMHRPSDAVSRAPSGLGRPSNDLLSDNAKSSVPGTVVNAMGEQPRPALAPMTSTDLGFGPGAADIKARYEAASTRERELERTLPREVWSLAHKHRFGSGSMLDWVSGQWANKEEMALRPLVEKHKDTIDAIRTSRREVDRLGRELDVVELAERLAAAAKEPRPADPPMSVYHGTDSSFDKYSGEIARSKSEAAKDIGMDTMFVTPTKEFAERFGEPMPLDLKSGYYFNVENMGDLARLAPFINSRPDAKRFWDKLDSGAQTWGMLEGRDTAAEIKRLGYDGVRMTEGYYDAKDRQRMAPTMAVFSQGKVARRGTDDIVFSNPATAAAPGLAASASQQPDNAVLDILTKYGLY
jgi:hypothetical protein